jgi:hypothetical protein
MAAATIDELLRDAVRSVLRDELRAAIRDEMRAALTTAGSASPTAPAPTDEYVTIRRAAEIASVHEQTVRSWQRLGHLHRYMAGDSPRARLSELHAYLARKDRSGDEIVDLDERARQILAPGSKRRS